MRVFLSYNNRDCELANRLRKALLLHRPDLEIYFAPIRNAVGAYWIYRLGEELKAADALLLLLGQRVGAWQELEYYEALKSNRSSGRPLIAPVVVADSLPGLHFLDQFHRLILARQPFEELVASLVSALDGAVLSDRDPPWRHITPYRGLSAMQTEDAAFFFGREAITADIIERLRRRSDRVLALIGNSGVGKSSIAMAGVLAALRSRLWPGDLERSWPADLEDSHTWLSITITPSDRPLKALVRGFAQAWLNEPADIEDEVLRWVILFEKGASLCDLILAAREKVAEDTAWQLPPRVFLYIDQGEELYSRAEAREARWFSRLLAEAVSQPEIAIMASFRSDYYGRIQDDEALFKVSERIDVPPFDLEQIERLIREPAIRLGVRFENPQVVPLIAEATAREPGSLPLLADMLSDAWESMRQDDAADGVLRFPFEIVDVGLPLAERADHFISLHPEHEQIVRRLFTLKLAHVPKEGEPVRRRVRRSECSMQEWRLVEELASQEWRLLSTGEEGLEPVAEVCHEALLSHWPRLRRWLDDAREFLIWKGQLEAASLEWQAAPAACREQALLMGLALDNARRWVAEQSDNLSESDRDFIDRSITSDNKRKRQQSWMKRLVEFSAVTFFVVSFIAIWQGMVAIDERQHAEEALHEAQITQARFLADKARELSQAKNADYGTAIALVITAMPQYHSGKWPSISEIPEVPQALTHALIHRRELHTLRGHGGPVNSASFSEDGSRVITASADGSARLWDAGSGTILAVLRGHTKTVNSAEFSGDGRRVVTASADGSARLWDAGSGAMLAALQGHAGGVNSAAFRGDGRRVVTASADGTARLWDANSGTPLLVLRGHNDDVRSAGFNGEGSRVVTASVDGTARLWDANSGEQLAVLQGHESAVNSASFSQDGSRVVTASADGTARLWDTESGSVLVVLRGHEGWVHLARFNRDGSRVVTVSDDGSARIWDAESGSQLLVLRGHNNMVNSAVFNQDGRRLVSASWDGTARLWDTYSGEELAVLRGHEGRVYSAAFNGDGNRVVTASADGTARLWDTDGGAEIVVLRGHDSPVSNASFNGDGSRVVTASADGTARLWDAHSGAQLTVLRGHTKTVNSVEFNGDGSRVVTASADGTARLWDAHSGTELAALQGHTKTVNSAVFSENGSRVVTASADGSARLWDAYSGVALAVLRGHEGWVNSAAFSGDGSRVVTASADGSVRLWDAASGVQLAVLRGHNDEVRSAGFNGNGSRVVSASADGTARLWDAHSGVELAVLSGHERWVNSAVFNKDGSRVATASADGTARLWDAASGAQLTVLRGHEGWVNSAVFSGDGSRVVTASADGTARLWDADNGTQLAVLRGHTKSVDSATFSSDGSRVITASWDGTARIWPHYQTLDELYAHASTVVEQLGSLTKQQECAYYLKANGCDVLK